MAKQKKPSVLTILIIAFLIITIILNFFVIPHLIVSKKIKLSEGTCIDFCDSVSQTASYSVIYNRRRNSFDCYCRDSTGWIQGKSSYPSLI